MCVCVCVHVVTMCQGDGVCVCVCVCTCGDHVSGDGVCGWMGGWVWGVWVWVCGCVHAPVPCFVHF